MVQLCLARGRGELGVRVLSVVGVGAALGQPGGAGLPGPGLEPGLEPGGLCQRPCGYTLPQIGVLGLNLLCKKKSS